MSSPYSFESYTDLDLDGTITRIKADVLDPGVSEIVHTRDSSVYQLQFAELAAVLRISTPTVDRDDGKTSEEGFKDRLTALQRGLGLVGLEQILTHSPQHEAVLTRKVTGERMDQLSTTTVRNITPEHLQRVSLLLTETAKRGIVIDSNPKNLFFDADEGFAIIDYGLPYNPDDILPSRQYAEFISSICGVAPIEAPIEEHQAWLRVFKDGVKVLDQTHGFGTYNASMILPIVYAQLKNESQK